MQRGFDGAAVSQRGRHRFDNSSTLRVSIEPICASVEGGLLSSVVMLTSTYLRRCAAWRPNRGPSGMAVRAGYVMKFTSPMTYGSARKRIVVGASARICHYLALPCREPDAAAAGRLFELTERTFSSWLPSRMGIARLSGRWNGSSGDGTRCRKERRDLCSSLSAAGPRLRARFCWSTCVSDTMPHKPLRSTVPACARCRHSM